MKNSEVVLLSAWKVKNSCEVKKTGRTCQDLIKVDFHFNEVCYSLYIDDEYNDFGEGNQLLCLYLVLRSLRDYKEENDFLKWCNLYSLNASDSGWLTYYKSLGAIVRDVEKKAGPINVFVNDLDYQLRSGAFSELVGR